MKEEFIEQYKKFKKEEVNLTIKANKVLNQARLSSITNEDGVFKINTTFIRDYDKTSYNLIGIKDNNGNIEYVCEDNMILTNDDISWETLIQIALEVASKFNEKN